MGEVIKLIYQPEWWFTTILIALTINILAGFVKEYIQNRYATLVKSWSERSEEKKAIKKERIERLANSNHELYLAYLELNHKKMNCIFAYVQAAVFLLYGVLAKETLPLVSTFVIIFALIFMFNGIRAIVVHANDSLVLLEVKNATQEKHNIHSQRDAAKSAAPLL